MITTYRDINRADLWVPGDILGGALLRGWCGPALYPHPNGLLQMVGGAWPMSRAKADIMLDCTRPEVRDHARRVLLAGGGNGAAPRPPGDIGPAVEAELRGDITPTEAAALVWCSLLRVEAGLAVLPLLPQEWGPHRSGLARRAADGATLLWVDTEDTNRYDRCDGWEVWYQGEAPLASGPETGEEGKVAADAAALASGYFLRAPGFLLLPLPAGVVGRLRLETP